MTTGRINQVAIFPRICLQQTNAVNKIHRLPRGKLIRTWWTTGQSWLKINYLQKWRL